ncbi:MFS transporter [Rhodohalobacter sp. SW132]|uniref:MFS transporter n=1 Tax=Rhodohalobacter sp. SW132 TaxID=2293433 RepID=UPI000E266BB7|nr:MFS transporter [Rhodohalobacter sp. SW132]REL33498.1 MFS transporter [Rhodohalobacter sp. SW132]
MLDIQKRLSNSFYALLALPSTAMGFALSVQIAALSWLLTYQYGLEITDIGLVWATGPIAGILGQVIIGIISDNVWVWNGRRRIFIVIGGTLASLMLLALPNIGVIQAALGLEAILGIAILISMVLDLSINVSFNPTRSIVADVTPEGRERTKGYTWMQTVSGTFGVLSYFIGAVFGNIPLIYFGVILVFLFSVIPPLFIKEPKYLGRYGEDEKEIAKEAADSAIPGSVNDASLTEILKGIRPLWGFLMYGIYAIIKRLSGFEVPNYYFEIFALIVTIYLIGEALLKSEAGKSKEEAGKIGFQKVLAAHSFSWIGVQSMFIYFFAFVDFQMPDLSNEEVGTVVNWSFFSLNLIAAIIPVLALEPLANKFGRVKTHATALGIMAVGYASIIFMGDSPYTLYILMMIVGIGWASIISLPFAIMSQKIAQNQMGLYMGLFNLSVVLPQLVSSFAIGDIVSVVENKNVLLVVCSLTVAFSSVAWFLVREPVDEMTENPVLLDQEIEEKRED